jgi:hypothetical protein
MNPFKETCINLRRSGKTLNEIVEITGRPKTSVYAHIRSITLPKEKLREIKRNRIMRALGAAKARRGKSARPVKQFNVWNVEMVQLVSHLMFDGSITASSCVYNNRNNILLEKVQRCMSIIYEYEPKKYTNQTTGVNRISYHNVALANFLKQKRGLLLRDIYSSSKILKREFLSAFFDDEGCVDFQPKHNRRQVRGYQKNISILKIIQNLLLDFDIESRIVKPNEVVISGKKNLDLFSREINFTKGVCTNGKRSNSIWKQNLEKCKLLEVAIQSFGQKATTSRVVFQ